MPYDHAPKDKTFYTINSSNKYQSVWENDSWSNDQTIDIVALLMLIPRIKGLKQKIDGDGKSPRLLSNRKHVIQFHHFYIMF